MIGKLAVALAAPFLASAYLPPANTEIGIDPAARPEVVYVRCAFTSGSAFYVGKDTLLSVAHVTSAPDCRINGKPFEVIYQSGDFTVLHVDTPVRTWLRIDCEGFQRGRKYTAWGFARGLPTLTTVDLVAKGDDLAGFARLWGVFNVIPGQSGGPIIDPETSKVAGTINVYNAASGESGSVELKGTALCASDSARP